VDILHATNLYDLIPDDFYEEWEKQNAGMDVCDQNIFNEYMRYLHKKTEKELAELLDKEAE